MSNRILLRGPEGVKREMEGVGYGNRTAPSLGCWNSIYVRLKE